MSAGQVLAAASVAVGVLMLPAVFLAVAVWVSWRRECRRQSVSEAELAERRVVVEDVVLDAEAIVRAAAKRMRLPG